MCLLICIRSNLLTLVIIRIKEGRVVESGTHEELIRQGAANNEGKIDAFI